MTRRFIIAAVLALLTAIPLGIALGVWLIQPFR
jgi:hypothetical protein